MKNIIWQNTEYYKSSTSTVNLSKKHKIWNYELISIFFYQKKLIFRRICIQKLPRN